MLEDRVDLKTARYGSGSKKMDFAKMRTALGLRVKQGIFNARLDTYYSNNGEKFVGTLESR